MIGLEKMLPALLGMSEEEMQVTVANAMALLNGIDGRFKALEEKQDKILALLGSMICLPVKDMSLEEVVYMLSQQTEELKEATNVEIGTNT